MMTPITCKRCSQAVKHDCSHPRCVEAQAKRFCGYGCMSMWEEEKAFDIARARRTA
jgi:hypothetical protein